MRQPSNRVVLPHGAWRPRDYQVNGWRAMAGQADQRKSEVCLAWHRRAGKDDLAGHALAIRAMERVGNYWHCLVKQEQARRAIWEGVNPHTQRIRWKDWFPETIIKHVDNQSMKLTFINGSSYQLFGSDNADSMVGSAPVGIAYSEAALADPSAFGLFRPILAENRGFAWYISSVRGRNHFYDIYNSVKASQDGYAELLSALTSGVFTPETLERERIAYIQQYGSAFGKALFEQEYLSSWDAAVIGAVFGEEIKALREDGGVFPSGFDPRYPVYTSWDFGQGDPTYILFWQLIGTTPRLIDWYSGTYTGLDHYAEILASKPFYYADHIAPHDARSAMGPTATSWYEQGKKLGIHFNVMPKLTKQEKISAGSMLLRMAEVNADPDLRPEDPMDDCTFILDAWSQYRFKFDRERKVMSKDPVHDWTSHPSDAMMEFGVWLMSQKHFAGRAVIQGRGADGEGIRQHRKVSIRSIIANQGRGNKVRGAWG